MREMRAAELMTPDPIVVQRDASIAEVASELREHDIGSVPVVESRRDKRLVGVITDRDIAVRCSAEGHDPRQCTAADHMSVDVRSARAGDDLDQVMRVMQGGQVRRVPVLDDKDRVLGIIAQADLAVEAADEEAASRIDIAYTLERISHPAHPQRKTAH